MFLLSFFCLCMEHLFFYSGWEEPTNLMTSTWTLGNIIGKLAY